MGAARFPAGRARLFRALAVAIVGGGAAAGFSAHARTFQAEGADSLAGLGARYVAMAGAGVAISDDVYAAYFNPAGLSEIAGPEASVSRQLNGRLREVNFVGVAAPLPATVRWGFRSGVAGIYYPRMHARATGAFKENEVESVFLRYLLPGLPGDFDGEIDSKTKVYRLAFGLAPVAARRWAIGFNVDRIDCRSRFCGVHATSNGRTTISSGATATSYGAGFRYRPSSSLTLGAAVGDADTTLDVGLTTTDAAGERHSTHRVAFPRKTLLGAAWRVTPAIVAAADYEVFRGDYGSNDIDIQVLRLGVEFRHSGGLFSRFGLLAPVRIASSNLDAISPPFPVSPSAGVAFRTRHLRADLAVYIHPLMSLHENGAAPAADLSISWTY